MIKKTTPYIYIFLFFTFISKIKAQELSLKIVSKDSLETTYLQNFLYKKKHTSVEEIQQEIESLSYRLKTQGYFTNTIDSISKKDRLFFVYISLGKRTKKAIISIPKHLQIKSTHFNFNKNLISVEIEKITVFLKEITNYLEDKGHSFSEVRLTNLTLKKKILFATLDIQYSSKRKVDKVIVKGYEHFPSSFIKHFFKIKKNTVFNRQKIKEISKNAKSISFASEIKPPEVLFEKDSTIVYLYLKKEKRSSFDGIINFSSKENSNGVLFTGRLNLTLTDILHKGETFNLQWKSLNDDRQDFKIETSIPYIYNTPFSSKLFLAIYKQDSTYINSSFNGKITLDINPRKKISLFYNSEKSDYLLAEITTIKSYQKYFIGTSFNYTVPENDFFRQNRFFIEFTPSFGKRIIENKKESQIKIKFKISYLWNTNQKNSIYINNSNGYLYTKTIFNNELFRIGGINSIRGFDEQSIYASKYNFINLELRRKTSESSYFHSITDVGIYKSALAENNYLIGIGAGYVFQKNSNLINFSYTIKKTNSNTFDLNSSKINIILKTYF